ncbi:hypothetical protein XAUC_11240 [Xanthomonas citri pv. aurantifolii str. ICPB 10535]|nr:hypothetical protein XAUC_11240 [Xanthomonas citri pv. aurantifolii str. ICPB 10535]
MRCHACRADGELVGLTRVLGILLDRGGELFHRSGRFFQVGRLLLGALRQVVVAGGNLAGGRVDGQGGVLDAAHDVGQALGGRIGVVAQTCEYPVELPVHARGQVAIGHGAEQLRQLAQVAVADFHHRVQIRHHHGEVVLEALCIATRTEVTGGGGLRQVLDLGVDRQQAGLGCIHCFMQHRAAGRQATRIFAQVALGILIEDAHCIDDGIEMLEDHRVDAGGEVAVDAGEIFRHAVGDVFGSMQVRHARGFVGETAQHLGHATGGLEHLADLVLAGLADLHAQIAARNRLDGAQCLGDRAGDAARDQPAEAHRQGGHQQGADQQHCAGQLERAGAGSNHVAQRLGLLCIQLVHRGEQFLADLARLLARKLHRSGAVGLCIERAQLLVGREIACAGIGQLGVLGLQRRGRTDLGVELLLGIGVLGLDFIHALEEIRVALRVFQIEELAHFVDAEFAGKTAQLGQAAQHRHHVLVDQGGFALHLLHARKTQTAQ